MEIVALATKLLRSPNNVAKNMTKPLNGIMGKMPTLTVRHNLSVTFRPVTIVAKKKVSTRLIPDGNVTIQIVCEKGKRSKVNKCLMKSKR